MKKKRRFYKGIILMRCKIIDYPKELYFIKAFYKIFGT